MFSTCRETLCTVAILKKKKEMEKLLEWVFGVFSIAVGVGFWGIFYLKLALKRSHWRCSYCVKIETVVKKPGFHTHKWK